jgi:hypothetical protein
MPDLLASEAARTAEPRGSTFVRINTSSRSAVRGLIADDDALHDGPRLLA